MRILLTGATGFIGSNFLHAALGCGHEMAVLVRPQSTGSTLLPAHERLRLCIGTLENPPLKEIKALAPEACVHAAWTSEVHKDLQSPENDALCRSSLSFLDQVQKSGCSRFLVLGTCIEYAVTGSKLMEDSPLNPLYAYPRTKNDLRLALNRTLKSPATLAWGRVFYPYGPGERPDRLCSTVIRKFLRGEKIFLKTPRSIKDYIFIDDLVSAMLMLLETGFHGPINLGTGIETIVQSLVLMIAQAMNVAHLVEDDLNPVSDPYPFVVADPGKLCRIGWQPAHTLTQGLEKLIRVLASKK